MSVTQEAGLIYICFAVESHGDCLFSGGCGAIKAYIRATKRI